MKKILAILISLFGITAYSQEFRSPLDVTLSMSSNFGELRANHFHSGVDYRVGGVSGAKVYAIADGYVSRIFVSPRGYGKALYISHPNGYTSLYAHLDDFAGEIAKHTKEGQYKKEKFTVNEYLDTPLLKVKKGDVIGYAGNTGSSFGAHLHFEVRESQKQVPLNIITKGWYKAVDELPPTVHNIAIYTLDSVNEMLVPNILHNKKATKVNNSTYNIGQEIYKVKSPVYFGLCTNDYQQNNTSKHGIYQLKMYVDNELFYQYNMDGFEFAETRMINAMIDYEQVKTKNQYYMKSYIEPGNKLNLFSNVKNNGLVLLKDNKVHEVKMELLDDNKNKSTITFKIQNDGSSTKKVVSPGRYLPLIWNDNFSYSEKGLEVDIPKEAVYSNTFFTVRKDSSVTAHSYIWTVGNPNVPIHKEMQLSIQPHGIRLNSPKALIVRLEKGKKIACGGSFNSKGYIETTVREFGTYAIELDTVAPTITLRGKTTDFTKSKRISLAISDNLSGIEKYNGYIDDKWVLFQFDPKNNNLFFDFDNTKITKGKTHKLKVVVSDYCGNEKVLTSNFKY